MQSSLVGRRFVCVSGRRPALGALALMFFGALATLAPPAKSAEPSGAFDVIPLDPEGPRLRLEVDRIRVGTTRIDDAQRKTVDEYYGKYALARWTQPEGRSKIVEDSRRGYRRELQNEIRLTKGEVHSAFNAIVLNHLAQLAAGNYHWACRVNAMLAIGELNEVEMTSQLASVPYAPAAEALLVGLTDPKQIDAVRVAALSGLIRHVQAKTLSPEFASRLTAACLALIGESKSPEGRSPDGHQWMRAQAADILGGLGSPGQAGAAALALAKLVGEAEAPLRTRQAAAAALAALNFNDAAIPGADAMVGALAKYAFDAVNAESETDFAKRRLKERVLTAATAAAKVRPAVANGGSGPTLDTLDKTLQAMIATLEGRDDGMFNAVKKHRDALEPLAKAAAGAG